jgi:hypothetical protein
MSTKSLFVVGAVFAVTLAGSRVAHAQENGPPEVCFDNPLNGSICLPIGEPITCGSPSAFGTPCATLFTPEADTWTFVFGTNNAIKIGTVVNPDTCPGGFPLVVRAFEITQAQYQARKHSDFADTVCNPSAETGALTQNCVFFRVHGETAPQSCYQPAPVDYKIFWNVPLIKGNKHDWMLLRAPCEEFEGDPNTCDTDLFSEDITTGVDKKPPVGTDPVVSGQADGMSDYIVAISCRHPHPGYEALCPR